MIKTTDKNSQALVAAANHPAQPRTAEAIVDAFKQHALSRLKDGLVPHDGIWSTVDARRAAIRAYALRQRKRRIEFTVLTAVVFAGGLLLVGLTALILY